MQPNYKIDNPAKGLIILKWNNKVIYLIDEDEISGDERLRIVNSTNNITSLVRNDNYTIIVINPS